MLAWLCSKSFKLGFNSMWTESFHKYKLDLEKGEESEIKLPIICWIIEKAREFQKNFCFIYYTKAFDCVDHNKLWKILKKMGVQATLPAFWETCMRIKKQQLQPDMEQLTASKLGKEYVKAIYCHPAYSTSMQSTSWEKVG